MPRYYFHIKHKNETVVDHEGSEHSCVEELKDEAIESARQIMAARILAGRLPRSSLFRIVDETDSVVLVVPFTDAFECD